MKIKVTENLLIKEFEIADTNLLYELMNDEKVMEFIPDRFNSLEEMKEVLNWLISNYSRKDYIRLTYKLEYKKEFAGWISFGPLPSDETRKEVAYVVKPELWGKKIASESLKCFIDKRIRAFYKNDIYAEVDTENVSSISVLKKNGFEIFSTFKTDDGTLKYLYRLQES